MNDSPKLILMSNVIRLKKALWANFTDDIVSGVPVYFNFSKYLISNLVASEFELRTSDEGFTLFLKECRDLLEFHGLKVRVKEKIFDTQEDSLSNVIILIALQVVAAEFMAKEQDSYTSSAYFPPLRKLISPSLGTDSVLPFDDEEYKRLWNVFRNEVILINKDAFITFDVVGKGANLNRIFPLSQALLNQRDLVTLATTFYMQGRKLGLVKDEEFNWRSFLISNSRNLSSRGFFCVTNEVIRPAVIDQLINFIHSFTIQEILKIDEKLKTSSVAFQALIIENEDDFFSGDETTIRHVFLDELGQGMEEFAGKTRLFSYLERKHYLTLRGSGGIWKGDGKLNFEESIDRIAFLSRELDFLKYVETSLGISNLSVGKKSFENDQGYFLYYIDDDRCKNTTVSIIQGVIRSKRLDTKLDFCGGIRIDNRSHNYFSDYPPTYALFEGKRLNEDDLLLVNSKPTSHKSFFDYLQSGREQSFSISFRGETLSLSLRQAEFNKVLVGTLVEDRFISFKTRPLTNNDKGIIGFTFQNIDQLVIIERQDFLDFFIPEHHFFTMLDKKEIETLTESVMRSTELGPAQKNYLSIHLRETSLVPKRLALKIKKLAA